MCKMVPYCIHGVKQGFQDMGATSMAHCTAGAVTVCS